ncbi:MAG TPA: carbon-nitrogen hydrolase family protein [Acidobacteriota bacterium]|nr:carbon-nitrogen hydrolase family protein [Acidobacteriota bacterium]
MISTGILLLGLAALTYLGGDDLQAKQEKSMVYKRFKLALVQMLVEGGEKEKNLERAEARIREAASQGANIVVLPEAMDLGWTHPSALTNAEPIPDGSVCRRLMKAARENRVYVCSGLTERAGDLVFNSAVLLDPKGEVLIRHRKLNELDIGHDLYAQGDRLSVCQTEFGTVGVLICADATAAHYTLLRTLGYMGADIVLSPSAWAVPPDHDNRLTPYGDTWRQPYQTVGREFAMWIAGVSNVGKMVAGPWKGWNCIGCSLVVDARGNEVLQGPYGAEADRILYVEVETVPRPARGTDWHKYWDGRGK